MPEETTSELWVRAVLPAPLGIAPGTYDTSPHGEPVEVLQAAPVDGFRPTTLVQVGEPTSREFNPDEQQQQQLALARKLLTRTNRVLRWYRAVSRNSAVAEVSQWQLSPFTVFLRDALAGDTQQDPLVFTTPNLGANESLDEAGLDQFLAGLSSGLEPEVAILFLQDAQYALLQGRFREAVLFAWATIDSQFSRLYDELVDKRLRGDWSEGRKQLAGLALSLRTKMTVVLNLLSGESLFLRGQPGDAWNRLAESYGKRNRIIHRGETASQGDAQDAIHAAEWVIAQLEQIRTTNQGLLEMERGEPTDADSE